MEPFEDLYEEAPVGHVSTLPDGTIVRVNRRFEQMTGRSREDLLAGRRLTDLLTAGGRVYHETHYAPLLAMQGEVREIALEIVRADGSLLPVYVNSVLRRDGDGGARDVVTSVFEATDRREYERELLLARRRAERLQQHSAFLAHAARELGAVRGVIPRAQRLAELLVPGSAEGAVVFTAEPVTLVAAAGVASADTAVSAAVQAALATGETRLGELAASEAGEDARAPVAALPLMLERRVIGAVGLSRRQHVDGIAAEDLALLEDLADRAALALENARLYEYEHEVAHTLQRSMLAGDPPHHPLCAIGVHYAPAEDTLEVGGDWYDAFFLGEDRVALVVGDVVGRGLPAATTMGQLRSAVRALAGSQLGPAGVLENLDTFAERAADARGATVIYAELDLRSGRLALAAAGHPPPVLAAPGREPELVWGGRSAPLGAYAGAAARDQLEMELERGSRLLFYTDGLVERRERSLDVGFAQLAAAFARAHATPVDELGAVLSAEMLAGLHGADDVCLLALAFGSGEPFQLRLPADAGRLTSLRSELRTWLQARGVSGGDRDAVVLACSEMAANAIEHGYRDGDGPVCVTADTAPGEVTVAVRDRGAWRMPSPGRAGRGRGLKIAETMMDEVVMDRGQGTRVTMRRRLREPR